MFDLLEFFKVKFPLLLESLVFDISFPIDIDGPEVVIRGVGRVGVDSW